MRGRNIQIDISSDICLKRAGLPKTSEQKQRNRKNKEQDRGKEELPHEDDPSTNNSPAENSIK